MRRLLVIGIDGMDWPVLEPLLGDLPNLREIAGRGAAGEMQSIFPPDSIPSWVSIFTGLDPSEHGILETIDYFKKGVKTFSVDTAAFRGATFWDRASAAGSKVVVVNPLLAYPPWPVNGIMASGPVFVSGRVAAFPEEIARRYAIPPLGGIVDFPEKRELASFAEKSAAETERIVDFAAGLLSNEPWDLAFVTLLTLDRMFHFFWRYQDPADPTHPRRSAHTGVIRDFHFFLDRCVGKLRASAGEDALVLIVSDHGHGMRAPLQFNLNELLRRDGLLKGRFRGPAALSPRYHVDNAKNLTLELLHRLDLEDLSYRIAHLFPWTRKLKKGDFLTKPSDNLATASEFGGANPFGGVDISKGRCAETGIDYEELRTRVITLLGEAKDAHGRPVFLWARRREELYRGPRIDRYPDILYEMRPEYGTNWSIHRPLVTVNPRHRKISGGHRSSGVMIAGPLGEWRVRTDAISPLNVAASVLAFLADGRPGAAGALAGAPGTSFLEKR
jgi:predicted AlkP superfamily phosphohydrolase/phosphomutase